MPRMRNVDFHEQLPRLSVLPHVQFYDWIYKLAEYKYTVHLMPAITAGTFCLNSAFLGIPCIGYKESDPQRLCQPNLSVELYDIESAMELARLLKNDKDFYNDCSKDAINNYNKYYNEKVFLDYMGEILNETN